MEAKEAVYAPQQQQAKQGIRAKAPIGQSQVADLELVEQLLQQV